MRLGRRQVIILSIVASLCVATFVAWYARRDASPGVTAADAWPVGHRAVYEMTWTSLAEAAGEDPSSGTPRREMLSRLDVRGRLQVTRLDGPAARLVLHVQVLDPVVDLTADGAIPEADVQAELAKPFLVHFGRDGLVTDVQLATGLGTTGFTFGKSVAALLQRPTKIPDARTWKGQETDISGNAEFTYRLSGTALEKQKERYLSLVEGVGGTHPQVKPTVVVLESLHRFLLGAEWLAPVEEVHVQERTRVTLGEAFAPMESTLQFSLAQRSSPGFAKDAEIAVLGNGKWESTRLDGLPPAEVLHRDVARQAVAGRTLNELSAAMSALESLSPRDRQKEARLFSALTNKLRLDASALREAEHSIRAGRDQRLLLDALGSAGTPESQALLVQLLSENLFDREQTRSSLVNLSLGPSPSEATIAALEERTKDPSHGPQATLGLGSIAHSLADSRPERAIELVDEISDKLESAKTPTEQSTLLKSLGNSGHPLVLDDCERFMSSPESALRLAAAECARLVPGPRADTLLAQALRDTNEHVANAAAAAALQRPYSTILLSPLEELARGSGKKSLRTSATQVLARWLKSHPELRDTIAIVAQSDQDEELRNYASNVLAKQG